MPFSASSSGISSSAGLPRPSLACGELQAGDQIVTLEIHTPKAETEEQKRFYESMATTFDFNPRVQ